MNSVLHALNTVESVINTSLNNKLLKIRTNSGPEELIKLKKLIIGKTIGIVVISEKEERVTICDPSIFEQNPSAISTISSYVKNRPRLKCIDYVYDIEGVPASEKAFTCLKAIQNSNDEDKVYEMSLLVSESGTYFKNITKNMTKEGIENERLNTTFQCRMAEISTYAAMVLAMSGLSRGVINNKNSVYSVEHIGGKIVNKFVSNLILKNKSTDKTDTNKRLEPEKLSCTINNIALNDNNSLFSTANLINVNYRKKFGNMLDRVTENLSGIVYLKGTMVEEIINSFYEYNYKGGIVEKGIVLGAYLNATEINHSNPGLNIVSISTATGNSTGKECDDIEDTIRKGSSIYSFYIVPENYKISGELLQKLSNNALVFICNEFGNLAGICRDIQQTGDVGRLVDKIIFAGSVNDFEGIICHPFIKRKMIEKDLETLNNIPMELGKDTIERKFVNYDNIFEHILGLSDCIYEIIITDKIKIINNVTSNESEELVVGYKEITSGELIRIIMSLCPTDVLKEVNTRGQVTTIIKQRVKDNLVSFKLTVIEEQDTYKLFIRPIVISSTANENSHLFNGNGLSIIAGEPNSAKGSTISNLCQHLDKKNKILVLDANCGIVEESFSLNNRNITFVRHKDLTKIDELLGLKYDTVIVHKINLYDDSLVDILLRHFVPSQQVIFSVDLMFSDFLRELSKSSCKKILSDMRCAINQIRVPGISNKNSYIYEVIDSEFIAQLGIKFDEEPKKIAKSVYDKIFLDKDSLNNQIRELRGQDKISSDVAEKLFSNIMRNYQ